MVNLGQNISSYQLLAQIASGGQATVYRARHTVLQREVAHLKFELWVMQVE